MRSPNSFPMNDNFGPWPQSSVVLPVARPPRTPHIVGRGCCGKHDTIQGRLVSGHAALRVILNTTNVLCSFHESQSQVYASPGRPWRGPAAPQAYPTPPNPQYPTAQHPALHILCPLHSPSVSSSLPLVALPVIKPFASTSRLKPSNSLTPTCGTNPEHLNSP